MIDTINAKVTHWVGLELVTSDNCDRARYVVKPGSSAQIRF